MKRLDQPDTCFVCARRAGASGVGGKRVGWLCDDCLPFQVGALAYEMGRRGFDAVEARALAKAGDAAGAYLDGIGQTDLARLPPENWGVFCRILVDAFGDAMREEVRREGETQARKVA